jgi:hypothetical protein
MQDKSHQASFLAARWVLFIVGASSIGMAERKE